MTTNRTKVAILGAGLMGHGIAQCFMVADFEVAIAEHHPCHRRAARNRLGISHRRKLRELAHQPIRIHPKRLVHSSSFALPQRLIGC